MPYFDTLILKGWKLGDYEELERFHEATNYHYEDYIYSAEPGISPYFVGDEMGCIPGGCHMECDDWNLQIFKVADMICSGGVTEQADEWRVMLANAGYDSNNILFDKARAYLIARMDY